MSKRKRELPKPKASFFDSPPSSPPTAAGRKSNRLRQPPPLAAPDRPERRQTDPEFMTTMGLWVAPDVLYERYGLSGFIMVLESELFGSATTGSYTKQQIVEIQNVIANLISNAVKTPVELVQRIAQLTVSVTEDVRKNLKELAEQFSEIAGGESDLEIDELQLRF